MKNIPLSAQIFVNGSIFVSILVIIIGSFYYYILSNAVKEQIGNRALSIAVTTANRPDIIAGFDTEDPYQVLQPIAETIRKQTEAEYVVIGNNEGIRYAHPILNRIGKKMVGDDNERALKYGESYISEATGSLGPAIRGKSAIKNSKGEIIGVVSVGFLLEDISSIFFQYMDNIIFVIVFAIGLGIVGSAFLARSIKNKMFGLEPYEIGQLYTERNTVIESVREGILMFDSNGKIKMANKSALEVITRSKKENIIGKLITDVIPHFNFMGILETGKSKYNNPLEINKQKVVIDQIPMFIKGKCIGGVASFRLQSDIDRLASELSQVKRYTEALRAQTHDYKNFLYTISGLIQLNLTDEALRLIHKETKQHQTLLHFITKRLQDPYLGGLIIGLYNRAKELKIKFMLDEDTFLTKISQEFDKSYFVSILGNLVTNSFEAVEHLPELERVVRVLIIDNNNEILIEVEDSGAGINPTILPIIFEQGVSTKNEKYRGYGLAKVKETVSDLGGNIFLEQGDLGGALFIVSIPKERGCSNEKH
ncbi:sensor histidine kinase [Caldifermentibacillus hisashii]|uniref:ATP-binding protein n=1 Tax=Bacillaceae TaxID=186817 RepID=UPI0022E30883|nr:sensor histidine kinase [Caldibacillus thermoamylovorans]